MNACCTNQTPGKAAAKLREWLAAGARKRLVLRREDFADKQFSLSELLFSGPWRERLPQRWRSFCVWMARYTPFSGWKTFWFRRAGVSIGNNVFFSPGAEIDLLFPQLVTLEDGAVMGLGALIVAHVYTPDRITIGRATVKRGGLVGGRAILAMTSIGEESVLGASSVASRPIPDGTTAIGVPAVRQKRKVRTAREKKENDNRP